MSKHESGGFRGWSAVASLLALGMLFAGAACARGRVLTSRDYARAERFMPYDTEPLVDHDVRKVHWLDDRRFWFIDHDSSGDHYRAMTAPGGRVSALFDQQKLAAALTQAAGEPVSAAKLSITGIRVEGGDRYEITRNDEHYQCDLEGAAPRCVDEASLVKAGKEPGILSPDRKLSAFIRNWNLWVRNTKTGRETQLTFDGVKNFGYATDNAGWRHSDRPVLDWSPDSKEIATYRQDQRRVGGMYLVGTRVGHPRLEEWKYALPGDKQVFLIEPVVIDVATRKVVRLELPPQQRLSEYDHLI